MKKWILLPGIMVLAATFAYGLTTPTQACDVLPEHGTAAEPPTDTEEVQIPAQAHWIDYGVVLASGDSGAWDDGLGMAPAMSSIVVKDGTFFLYYVGFDGVRESDQGERNRTIGVATSPDGVRFEKYAGNPIITFRPNNNEEETAGGMAATLDDDGNVILFWGAADAGSTTSTSVDSDIRLSISNDGFNFTDLGDVIRHNDSSVWGYGDELYPLGIVRNETTWSLYYMAKGLFGIFWDVGVASGPTPDTLTQTRCALTSDDGSFVFGGGSIAELGPDTHALFLVRNNAAPYLEALTFSASSPHQLSEPVETYHFEDFWEATVVLDTERKTWFMYYLDGSSSSDYFEWTIGLKLAPAGTPDTTPPSAPVIAEVTAKVSGVDLRWDAAEDTDTGIARYNIYRDSEMIGNTPDPEYRDTDGIAVSDALYQVSAVNFHGLEGPLSEPVTATPHDCLSSVPFVGR